MAARGLFITLEGIEGVGKSTQVQLLADYLSQQQIDFVQTREPGGTVVAEQIRNILLQHQDEQLTAETELLLMFAARRQHIVTVIEPALAAGRWVLCDRFTEASFAYQGGGRELGAAPVAFLEQFVQQELRPDCCLLLDAPVSVGLARAKARSDADRFEAESAAFFNRVRDAYLERARQQPQTHAIIDATLAIDAVHKLIVEQIQQCQQHP